MIEPKRKKRLALQITSGARTLKDLRPQDHLNLELEEGGSFLVTLSSEDGNGPEGYMSVGFHPESRIYYVTDVRATPGWGPLMYDAAMKYASDHGAGLAPDQEGNTSEAASRVWKHYHSKRQDVEHQLIPEEGVRSEFFGSGEDPYLDRLYRMKTAHSRLVTWNSPTGQVQVSIKRIHSKSARVIMPDGTEKVLPVSELSLHQRWKSRYKSAADG